MFVCLEECVTLCLRDTDTWNHTHTQIVRIKGLRADIILFICRVFISKSTHSQIDTHSTTHTHTHSHTHRQTDRLRHIYRETQRHRLTNKHKHTSKHSQTHSNMITQTLTHSVYYWQGNKNNALGP